MNRFTHSMALLAVAAPLSGALAAPGDPDADAKIVAEATGQSFKALEGQIFDKDCEETVDYAAEVVDLNGDGQPEVFTMKYGPCYGRGGGEMDLLIKDRSGQWVSQFGFSGSYEILGTSNLGFPDIEILGPGMCLPVWRWNGSKYDLFKQCPPGG